MASAGGLTRRRGGGGGATTSEDEDTSRVASPAPKNNASAAETSYTGGENGHKIAFDPRDISESEERSKQPKLTLMEEILLIGLKDKQVRFQSGLLECDSALTVEAKGLPFVLERQHLLRSPWLYSHRVSLQRTNQHAERLLKTSFSFAGSSH